MKKRVKKLFQKLALYLYNFLPIDEIEARSDWNKWDFEKKKFKKIGENCQIQKPYYFINSHNITLGNDFVSMFNLRLETFDQYNSQSFKPKLVIGNNVRFGSDCHVGCVNSVTIQDNVLIASKVYISDHLHGKIDVESLGKIPLDRDLVSPGPVLIEENVWIGEGVVIMPGITIGKNSIIGANAVVTKSVPPNSVAAGVPAKIIKYLV